MAANRTSSLLRRVFAGRPWWMNVMMVFCAYMAVIYVPWDFIAKDVADDAEVWFGVRLYGWAAKLTEPLHLAIYAAGAYGFFRMRPWMWPWAALYAAQVTVSMLLWALLYGAAEAGVAVAIAAGLTGALLFGALTIGLWRARPRFVAGSET